ncbi:MAG: acyl-CoA thioesterase [Planctomycetota bacterium]|jgi:acyl-CoA hydrolase
MSDKGGASPPPRAPAESQVETRELILPNDTNTHGNVLGGKVLHAMDLICAMTAIRHCRRPVVTAAMDHVEFLHSIPEGHFMLLKASVNCTGSTSMEVGVKVLGEHPHTGVLTHTSSAYLTFVALDEDGRPTTVPPVDPQNDEERRRFSEGRQRTQERRSRRKS